MTEVELTELKRAGANLRRADDAVQHGLPQKPYPRRHLHGGHAREPPRTPDGATGGALEEGRGKPGDLEILAKHCRLLGPGRTFCAHAPGAVEPLQSALKYFRGDFEAAISKGVQGSPLKPQEAA